MIGRELEGKFIRLPTGDDIEEHIREFTVSTGFPQGFGSLNECRIEVSPPHGEAIDYHIYKECNSTVLLALVDHKYNFMYINFGSPGRNHDAGIYHKSSLPALIASPQFSEKTVNLGDQAVGPVILCDQAFPLQANLMKPYPNQGRLAEEQQLFNYTLSKARRVVENAFGRLKARFRILGKGLECDVSNANSVIRACCTLHNVCEQLGDTCEAAWAEELQQVEQVRSQPAHTSTVSTTSGTAVRNAIADYLMMQKRDD